MNLRSFFVDLLDLRRRPHSHGSDGCNMHWGRPERMNVVIQNPRDEAIVHTGLEIQDD